MTKETDIWLQIAVTSFWSNRESAYNQILPFNSIITFPFWPFISAAELKEIFVTSFTEYFHAWASVCDDNIKVRKEIKNWELQKSEGNLCYWLWSHLPSDVEQSIGFVVPHSTRKYSGRSQKVSFMQKWIYSFLF